MEACGILRRVGWCVVLSLAGFAPLVAGAAEEDALEKKSFVSEWWGGEYATGSWLGVRDTLAGRGLSIAVEWKSNFLWNVDGGLQQRFGYDDEWRFRANLDVARLTGWSALEGLTLASAVRYRGGDGVNRYTGASANFGPSAFQTGRLWRFQVAYATYTTPELFGIRKLLTLSAGWQNPAEFFLDQLPSKLFVNNSFSTGKGISANGIPWGGSYSAWGGYLRANPASWFYAQTGLYLAIPFGSDTSDHGLDFAGYRRNPNLNGLYWLAETGFTPQLSDSRLPGKYAVGFLYWGVENRAFRGETTDQRAQLYFQADQMLYREPDRSSGPSSGKAVQEATPPGPRNKQGVYFFSLFNVAPAFQATLPFYFHAGLVYQGPLPGRDRDQAGIAFGLGSYSAVLQDVEADNGQPPQTSEGVLEFFYRVQINSWAYIQPDFQYVIQPNGTGQTPNATILGFQLGAVF